jgi:hypothetical protein
MPESRGRKTDEYIPPPQKKVAKPPRVLNWVAPAMVAMLVIGLLWVVVYYVSSAEWPIGALGDWNLLVGMAFIGAGCVLATKWR